MFKILVLEDDMELNKTVCSFLNQNGYEATGSLTADDAYDRMYETVFDLIISDIMMPETDGFEFAKTVREMNKDIPMLFMTARDDFASKQRGFRIGIRQCLRLRGDNAHRVFLSNSSYISVEKAQIMC